MGESAKATPGHPAAVLEVKQDAWANPQTGMGVPMVDPRTAWTPFARPRNEQAMRNLWLGDGLAGRIVEHPAEEMTRERGTINLGEGYGAAQEQLGADIDELDVWSKFAQALKYDRAFGGGALVMALDDGFDWRMPVDPRRLEKVTALHAATPDELFAVSYFNDPTHPQFGKPAVYRWFPASLPGLDGQGLTNRYVHASRVIAFSGIDVDNHRLTQNGGWGDSVLARCEERIRDTASALSGIGVALQNFSQDVIQSDGIGLLMADKNGRKAMEERIANFRAVRSMLGVWLLGKGEVYSRQGIPMGGVADTMHELGAFLSATTGMPTAVLMGYAEAGLGDAGASQRRIWHDWVRAAQSNRLRPAFNRLIRLMLLAKAGPTRGVEPPKWELEFAPLEKMTPAEEDTRRKTQADIDGIYLEKGVQRPEHIARHRFNGPKGFNPVTPPDPLMDVLPYTPPDEDDTEGTPDDGLEETDETAPVVVVEGPDDEPDAPTAPTPTPAPRAPEDVQKLSLNGAQVDAAKGVVQDVAMGLLPRTSGVAMLRVLFNLTEDEAEAIMGEVGTSFMAPDAARPASSPGAPRTDGAEVYARLLAAEAKDGGLTLEEVERKVARLYGVRPRDARAILKRLGRVRADAKSLTNFPRAGENRRVSLRGSRFKVFDPAYVRDLKENWPEVWALSANPLGAKQFERLYPMARAGARPDSDLEVRAVQLREEWARRNAGKTSTAGVVALAKWLVVGRAGEAEMRRVLEAAKDKARRARAGAGG